MKIDRSSILRTLGEIMRGPGTPTQIASRMGLKDPEVVYKHVIGLRKSGLIYMKDFIRFHSRGPCSPVYAIQEAPFQLPDAPRPVPIRTVGPRPKKPVTPKPPPPPLQRLAIDHARGVTIHRCLDD